MRAGQRLLGLGVALGGLAWVKLGAVVRISESALPAAAIWRASPSSCSSSVKLSPSPHPNNRNHDLINNDPSRLRCAGRGG